MVKQLFLLVFIGTVFVASANVWANDDLETDLKQFSNVAEDEKVIFFSTSAWLNDEKNSWVIPIHGWVYEPQDSRVRKAAVLKLLEATYDVHVNDEYESTFSNRVNHLLADNERGKEIVINLSGRNFVLPASDEHGYFDTTLLISVDELSHIDQDILHYRAVLQPTDQRKFDGEIRLVKPFGKSVISDIDDTVKLSYVTDRARLIEATFAREFAEGEGDG